MAGLFAISARAQQAASHVTIGPVAGLNYAGVYGSDASGLDSRTDFAVGGQLDADIAQNGFFRTGLVYSRRGFEGEDTGTTFDFKISYLEIPLLLGYRLPTSGGFQPYFDGGGQLGIKVGCTIEGSNSGVSASIGCDNQNIGADFSSTDFALVGGGGISVPVGLNHLLVDVHYALGLMKIEKSTEIKNRGFTFAVGFMMPIGK